MERIENLTIHVGLHKCGSTWLQQTVLPDPSLNIATPWGATARRAVARFAAIDPLTFQPEVIRAEFVSALSRHPAPAATVISEEALSSYPHRGLYYADTVAERLRAVFPEARILLIFREQHALILSLYAQYVKSGGRRCLEDFIGESEREVYWNELIVPSFFQFDALIRMYGDIFGADRVLALPFELLRASPETYLARLGDFMGVDLSKVESGRVVNQARSATMTEWTRRTNHFIHMRPWGPPHPRLHRLRERLIPALDRRFVTQDRRKAQDKALIRERFGDSFGPSNARTQELTGFDLAALGYTLT